MSGAGGAERWRNAAAALALVLAVACGGGTRGRVVARPSPYDVLAEPTREELFRVRYLVNDGRLEEARAKLAPVASAHPRSLRVAVFLQDVELELIASGGTARGIRIEAGETGDEYVERLFEVYHRRAVEVPTSEAFVLAARLAPNPDDALELLESALALDTANPWGHYGKAWAAAASGRNDEALGYLEAVRAIDPGHLPSLRLEATLLGEVGEAQRADATLRAWFDLALRDPTIDPARFAEARVDLALARVAAGEPGDALDWLEDIEDATWPTMARAELVRAAALASRGDIRPAFDAARRAQAIAPDELLALVHQAQLLERFDNSAEEQRKLWERVLEVIAAQREADERADESVSSAVDFQSLLIQLQAHARLERLEREATLGRGKGS